MENVNTTDKTNELQDLYSPEHNRKSLYSITVVFYADPSSCQLLLSERNKVWRTELTDVIQNQT